MACVDSLRDKELSLLNGNDKRLLLMKSKALIVTSSLPIKKVLELFIEKLVE